MKKKSFTQRHCRRNIAWLLLAFLALLPGLGAYATDTSDVPTLSSDGYYEINTAAQLKWFRDLVNGSLDGTTQNTSANARLMADIDLNNEAWTPIGNGTMSGGAQYGGTFDGNNHTVSNLYINSAKYRGFIGCTGNNLIKNLGIVNAKIDCNGTDTVYYVGVVVGHSSRSTIQGCWALGNLELPTNVANTTGIVCTFYGKVKNCHTSYSSVSIETNPTFPSLSNSTANIATDAYKTGELAYLLNSNKDSGETGWGQIIGTDNHPVALIDGTNNVYQYGKVQEATTLTLGTTADANRMTTLCFPENVTLPEKVLAFTVTAMDGSDITINKLDESVVPAATPVILLNTGTAEASVPLSATSYCYSNSSTPSVPQTGNLLIGTYSDIKSESATVEPYTLVNSTFVRSSGTLPSAYQCYLEYSGGATSYTPNVAEYLDYPIKNSEDCYGIYNAAHLKWFRDLVNGSLDGTAQDKSANAKLMADIDLNNEAWTPIGTDQDTQYRGNFDGNYHAISNLYITDATICGFIGWTGSNLIKNLGIVNAKVNGSFYYVGVVAGYAYKSTIQGCWTSGGLNLTAKASTTGGIACTYNCTVKNCHTSYSKVSVVVEGTAASANCTAGLASDAYKTGVLAYLLNSNKESGETGWGQVIGTDEHPVALTADNIVYGVYSGSDSYTVQNVNETTSLGTNQLAFTDYGDVSSDIANIVANGKCQNFVLSDGIDFYSPSAFTATKVTYNRSFSDNDFNSLYLPFGANVDDFTGCEFYVINMFHQYDTDNDGILDAISLEVSKVPSGSTLLANHPYLFKYTGKEITGGAVEDVEFSLADISVEATADKTFDCSSMSYKYEFTGSSQGKSKDNYADYYVLGVDENGKTVLANPSADLPAMRWAMKMTARDAQYGSTPAQAPAKINVFVTGEDSTTGISSVSADTANADIYGVNGVRKSRMTEGLNIVKRADGKVIKVVKR